MKRSIALAAMGLAFAAGSPVEAKTLRVATNAEASTMDPHANNYFMNNMLLEHVYEPLVARDKALKPEPALAVSWERIEPTRWRFKLRSGVKFHDGSAFSAADAAFSLKRAMAPTSNYSIYIDSLADAVAVDDLTIDVVTKSPDAVLIDKLTRIFIMSKAWSEKNNSARPQNFAAKEETFASRNAMGTGPFVLRSREADQRTVMTRHAAWWGKAEGNVTEFVFLPIANDATRMSAILAGDADLTNFVPTQDIERLKSNPRVKVVEGQENRTLFLGMDQARDELVYSDVKGRNPFKDVRVRRAIAMSIDMDAIKTSILRGQAEPTNSMWTRYVNGYSADLDKRPALDQEGAKRLLADAGYPNGFKVTLDCPTGTYDRVCTALAAMLARIGIELQVQLQPPPVVFGRFTRLDTSFYGLAWGVPTFDALYTLRGIMMSRDKVGAGSWNAGAYSNPRVDALIEQVQGEIDAEKRRSLIHEAHRIHNEEYGHIPLYHLVNAWAMARNVTAPYRADNFILAKWVQVD